MVVNNTRLEKILRHAFDTVPFYMKIKETSGGQDIRFEDLPLIGKKFMIENMDFFLSNAYKDYDRTENQKEIGDKLLYFEFTSGSSGYPLQCYKTKGEKTEFGVSLYKKRKAIFNGFTNDKMFCFIHNHEFDHSSYKDSLGNLSEENIGKILNYLRDEAKPKVLHGNTMLLLYYARYIKDHNFDLKSWKIEFIESVSESISNEQKEFIGEQFKTRVFDCYGCLECYNVAYECPEGALHLNENVIIEIIDPDTLKPVNEKGKIGEVVLTSLVNKAQPFIRYKTGDMGYIEGIDCSCGNPRDVIFLTGKRKIDYLKLVFKTTDEKLHICGFDIFMTVMYRLVREGYDCVSWYNIIQTELDGFDVLYTRKKNFSDQFFELFKKYTEEELKMSVKMNFIEKTEEEVLFINRKNRVFRSNMQTD
ncbi:MAG: hypothetical protein N2645_08240 [Clostridia bacterium]|nr:hypothetical protein [Clostridia bacterium]